MLQHRLAKDAIGWIQAREMKGVCVINDSGFDHFVISCSDHERRRELETTLANDDVNCVFVNSGRLAFIGFEFLGRRLHSWYKFSNDAARDEIDPEFFLELGEETITYSPESWDSSEFIEDCIADFEAAWSADTKDDGIQVYPRITLWQRIENPHKALFAVAHYPQAIQQMVASAWKDVIQKLPYFAPNGGSENIQEAAQTNLRTELGFDNPKDESRAVGYILKVYGIRLIKLGITDIDLANDFVRAEVRKRFSAEVAAKTTVVGAEAAAKKTVIEATAQAKATIATGNAQATAKRALGSAEAKAVQDLITAQGVGREAQIKAIMGRGLSRHKAAEILVELEKFQQDGRLIIHNGDSPAATSAVMAAVAQLMQNTNET